MKKSSCSLRDEILEICAGEYRAEPERLWAKYPDHIVLRHQDNRKWFAIFMKVDRESLKLAGEGPVQIVNVKVEPGMAALFAGTPGYLPAYHMNKANWMSILLDGTVDRESILSLLDLSFGLTGAGRKGSAKARRITDWLIPANPRLYDIQTELARHPDEPFTWKQSSNIQTGDTVYIYMAAPVRAVLYRCSVLETDIPHRYEDEKLSIRRAMKLKLAECYDEGFITSERLKEHGVYAVRGPRSMPESLLEELRAR